MNLPDVVTLHAIVRFTFAGDGGASMSKHDIAAIRCIRIPHTEYYRFPPIPDHITIELVSIQSTEPPELMPAGLITIEPAPAAMVAAHPALHGAARFVL
jgi:hypothetical protein